MGGSARALVITRRHVLCNAPTLRRRLKGQTLRAVLFNPQLPGSETSGDLALLSSAQSILLIGQASRELLMAHHAGSGMALRADRAVVMHLVKAAD